MYKTISIVAYIVCFIIATSLIYAEIYQWTDEKGTIHFNDDYSKVPEKYQKVIKTRLFPKESSSQFKSESSSQSPQEISSLPLEEKLTLVLIPQNPEPVVEKINRIFTGMINRVDDREKTIFVAGDGKEMVFPVSKDTKIKTDHGVDVSFDKLKTAMSVMVAYTEDRGNIQTLDVRISMMRRGFGKIQIERQKEEQEKKKEEQNKKKEKQNVTAAGSKKTSKK